MLPKYTAESGLKYYVDDTDRLVLTKRSTHTAQVIVNKEHNAVLDLTQDGVPVYQQINTGGTTKITIVQK
jgi:hypothetical protein